MQIHASCMENLVPREAQSKRAVASRGPRPHFRRFWLQAWGSALRVNAPKAPKAETPLKGALKTEPSQRPKRFQAGSAHEGEVRQEPKMGLWKEVRVQGLLSKSLRPWFLSD